MVVIKDHGHAYEGVIDDDSHRSRMSIRDLKRAFARAEEATGKRPDIMAFDACGMASAEVLMALADRADYIVASEKVMYSPGFPHKEALSLGKGEGDFSPSPKVLVDRIMTGAEARSQNIDTYDSAKMGRLASLQCGEPPPVPGE